MILAFEPDRLVELLTDPCDTRMDGHTNMENPTAGVVDDEDDVEAEHPQLAIEDEIASRPEQVPHD